MPFQIAWDKTKVIPAKPEQWRFLVALEDRLLSGEIIPFVSFIPTVIVLARIGIAIV